MAKFTLDFNTPAEKDAELIAALNEVWNDPFATEPMTAAQLRDNFKMRCEMLLRNTYVEGKKRLAAKVADTRLEVSQVP